MRGPGNRPGGAVCGLAPRPAQHAARGSGTRVVLLETSLIHRAPLGWSLPLDFYGKSPDGFLFCARPGSRGTEAASRETWHIYVLRLLNKDTLHSPEPDEHWGPRAPRPPRRRALPGAWGLALRGAAPQWSRGGTLPLLYSSAT